MLRFLFQGPLSTGVWQMIQRSPSLVVIYVSPQRSRVGLFVSSVCSAHRSGQSAGNQQTDSKRIFVKFEQDANTLSLNAGQFGKSQDI